MPDARVSAGVEVPQGPAGNIARDGALASARGRLGALLARRPDHTFAPPAWLAWLAVAIVAAVHGYAAWGGQGPLIIPDETGSLGNAYVLSGAEPAWTLAGSGYMPGLGILLTPLWWIFSDPMTIYYGALAVGVVLATVLVWPLASIARYFGATRTGSIVIAAVVAAAPARTIESNYVLSESLVAVTTAVAVVVGIRFARNPTVVSGALLGLSASLPFLAHGRGLAIAVAVVAWSLLYVRRSWKAVAAVAGVAVAGLAAWYALFSWITDQLYWNDNRVSNSLDGLQGTAQEMLANLWGMSWYAVAAWPAVVAVALVVLISRIRKDPVAILLLVMGLGATAVAVVALSTPQAVVTRLDGYIYGRYIEHVLLVFATIGLALLARVRSGLLALTSTVVVAVVLLMFHVFTVPVIPVGGRWHELHVAGVSHYLSRFNYANDLPEPWALLSLATLGLTLCVLALAMVRGTVVWVLGVYMAGLSVADDALRVDPWDDTHRAMNSVIESASVQDQSLPITYDASFARVINLYAFALNPREVRVAYPEDIPDDTVYLYSSWDNTLAEEAGALPLAAPDASGLAIWVYPGEEQTRFAELGLLSEKTDASETPEPEPGLSEAGVG